MNNKEDKIVISLEELKEMLKKRLGDEDFSHEVDPAEWKDPRYFHQN